jgi:DNA-binding CsgD family transcriptional regulator
MGILMTRYRYQLGRDQAFDLLRIASQLGGRSLGPIRRNPTNPLTERQLQVLLGVSDGESNAEIGRDLFLATDTVKTHTRRIFRKLWVTDRGATTPSTAPKINRTTPVTASPSVASPRRRQGWSDTFSAGQPGVPRPAGQGPHLFAEIRPFGPAAERSRAAGRPASRWKVGRFRTATGWWSCRPSARRTCAPHRAAAASAAGGPPDAPTP